MRVYLTLVGFSLLGSLFSRLTNLAPGWIAPIAATLTLAAGCAAVLETYVRGGRTVAAVVVVLVVGVLAELIGLSTGYPFGHYHYTMLWWPTVRFSGGQFFPLQLPFAWLLIVTASYGVATLRFYGTAAACATGVVAALVDFVMEPVMTGSLHYWQWDPNGPLPGGAALLNPVGWFMTAFVASLALARADEREGPPDYVPFLLLCAHLGLMVGIGLISFGR